MPEFLNRPRKPSNPILVRMIASLLPLVTVKISIEIHLADFFGFLLTANCFPVLDVVMTYRYQGRLTRLIHTQMGGATNGRHPRQDVTLF